MLNQPPASGQTSRGASQENLLLDYVHRLERHRQDRKAVHIHLSGLLAQNRREHHMRIAGNTFENLVKLMQAQAFTLANGDLMVIYKAQAQDELEAAVVKLRFLFSDDPLVLEERTRQGAFCTWYALDKEYDLLLTLAQKMVQDEAARRTAATGPLEAGPPLLPLHLTAGTSGQEPRPAHRSLRPIQGRDQF